MRYVRTLGLTAVAVFGVAALAGCSHNTATNSNNTNGATATKEAKDNSKKSDVVYYETEQGTIEYELSGTETGTETLYFDNSGNRQATHVDKILSVSGITQKTKTMTLMDPEWIYTADLLTNKGSKVVNAATDIAKKAGSTNLTRMGKDLLEQMGAVKTGTDTIAGKTCEVWEMKTLSTTVCVWNGLTLKTSSSIGSVTITKVATRVDTSAPPADKFVLPSDITYTEFTMPKIGR